MYTITLISQSSKRYVFEKISKLHFKNRRIELGKIIQS